MSSQNVVVLDREEFKSRPEDITLAGTNVTFNLSPYDIPEAVSSYRNEREGTYVIEVKYMGPDEPTETVSVSKDVDVRTGRNSKRLYAFIVHHGDPVSKTSILRAIRSGVSELEISDSFPRKENYRAVDNVFSIAGDRLLDMLMFTNTGPIKKAAG